MLGAEILRRTRLNELELWRDMLRAAGGTVVEDDRSMMLAGPVPSLCVGIRLDQDLPAADFLQECVSFYADRSPGFSIFAEVPREDDLVEVCTATGFARGWTEHAMAHVGSPTEVSTPEGFEIRRVETFADVARYGEVVAEAFDEPERERARFVFSDPRSALAPNVAAFLAWDADGPVASALSQVSHGIAGVFWVATVERVRRRGLADAMTRAAARAGIAMGARAAWLGASDMGKGVYERIGFVPIGRSTVELGLPPVG